VGAAVVGRVTTAPGEWLLPHPATATPKATATASGPITPAARARPQPGRGGKPRGGRDGRRIGIAAHSGPHGAFRQ
jgi:hypothetical protein